MVALLDGVPSNGTKDGNLLTRQISKGKTLEASLKGSKITGTW